MFFDKEIIYSTLYKLPCAMSPRHFFLTVMFSLHLTQNQAQSRYSLMCCIKRNSNFNF